MKVGIGSITLEKHTKEGKVETHELHRNGQLLVEHIYDEETNTFKKNFGNGYNEQTVNDVCRAELSGYERAVGGIQPRTDLGEHYHSGNYITAFVLVIDNLNTIANSFVTKVAKNKTMKNVSDDNFIFMVIQNNQPHKQEGSNASMIRVIDLQTTKLEQAVKNGEQVIDKFKELNMTGYAILPKTFDNFHLTAEQYASIFQ